LHAAASITKQRTMETNNNCFKQFCLHRIFYNIAVGVITPMNVTVHLPSYLTSWLDGWGTSLQVQMQKVCQEVGCAAFGPHYRFLQKQPFAPLLVGTDCSGIDGPLWALRGLGIQFRHCFASEVAAAPCAVLLANTQPDVFYTDILRRKISAVPYVHVYYAGFVCKPFSLLHWKSKLLKDSNAKVFYACLAYIRERRPRIFVLENVMGLVRVLPKLLKLLRAAGGGYSVIPMKTNPVDLGEPVQRPRIYLVGIAKSVARCGEAEMIKFATEVWKKLTETSQPCAKLSSRLLPAGHSLLNAYQAKVKEQFEDARRQGFPLSGSRNKWQAKHAEFEMNHQTHTSGGLFLFGAESHRNTLPTADTMLLSSRRQRAVWTAHATAKQHQNLVLDASQSIHRCGVRCDNTLPTVTPGSIILLSQLQRRLTPVEKIMVHQFPVHRMKWPVDSFSDQSLSQMGGNTMHVKVVAAVTMLSLQLVDWTANSGASFREHPGLAISNNRLPTISTAAAASAQHLIPKRKLLLQTTTTRAGGATPPSKKQRCTSRQPNTKKRQTEKKMHTNQTAANTKKGNNNNNNVAGGGVLFQRHHHHYLQPFGQELLAKSVNKSSSSVKQPSHTKNWVHTAGHQTVVGSIAKQLATASNTNNRWGM
jgi:site-specific DNA-cytosine methylase